MSQCKTLIDLLKASKDILKHDALGRLKLIGWLHDFENIDTNIEQYRVGDGQQE